MNNWFVVANGLCWVGAACESIYRGNWRLAVVSVCYALATWALQGVK